MKIITKAREKVIITRFTELENAVRNLTSLSNDLVALIFDVAEILDDHRKAYKADWESEQFRGSLDSKDAETHFEQVIAIIETRLKQTSERLNMKEVVARGSLQA